MGLDSSLSLYVKFECVLLVEEFVRNWLGNEMDRFFGHDEGGQAIPPPLTIMYYMEMRANKQRSSRKIRQCYSCSVPTPTSTPCIVVDVDE